MTEEEKLQEARKFISDMDEKFGESWSDDWSKIAETMVLFSNRIDAIREIEDQRWKTMADSGQDMAHIEAIKLY